MNRDARPSVADIAPVVPNALAATGARGSLILLIALCVAWEAWLAPLRPGGSLMVLKALPLLAALPGVWRSRLYTLQWTSMLVLLYFMEGIVRGMSEHGASARLAWLEVLFALVCFVCALVYVAPFKRAAKQTARRQKQAERAAQAK